VYLKLKLGINNLLVISLHFHKFNTSLEKHVFAILEKHVFAKSLEFNTTFAQIKFKGMYCHVVAIKTMLRQF